MPASAALEEDFPLLGGGPTNTASRKTLTSTSNTVQWRVKPAVGDQQQRSKDDASDSSCQNEDKKCM